MSWKKNGLWIRCPVVRTVQGLHVTRYHRYTNWFSRMTNDIHARSVEVILCRRWKYTTTPPPKGPSSFHTHLTRRAFWTTWLKFILIFYLYPGRRMADKKHKCSWYCVLSYRAAKDWNPAKQFSEEMKERGLVNPGGAEPAVRGGRIWNKRQRISKIDKCTSLVTFPFAAPECEHFTILHLRGREAFIVIPDLLYWIQKK